jgi:hypothetical protein
MTNEDKRAQIDRRFDETFAVFDVRMRKEQETLSRDRAAGGGGGDGGDEGNSGENSDAESGQGDAAPPARRRPPARVRVKARAAPARPVTAASPPAGRPATSRAAAATARLCGQAVRRSAGGHPGWQR